METKICTKCGEEKPLDEFRRNKRYTNGIYSRCKQCEYDYNKQRNLDPDIKRKNSQCTMRHYKRLLKQRGEKLEKYREKRRLMIVMKLIKLETTN